MTNVGDQPTVGTVSVTDTPSTGLTPVSATGTGWTCDQRVTEVVCTLDSVIEFGATSDVTLVGTIAKSGVTTDLTNRASVVSDDDLDNVVDSADEGTALVEAMRDHSPRQEGHAGNPEDTRLHRRGHLAPPGAGGRGHLGRCASGADPAAASCRSR